MLASAEPTLNEQIFRPDAKTEMLDHVIIDFGGMAILRGKALPVAGDRALNLTGVEAEEGAPVIKQWYRDPADGRTFLIESVAWNDVWPQLKDLPGAQGANMSGKSDRDVASARTWPKA